MRFWSQAPNCFESEAQAVVPSPHRIGSRVLKMALRTLAIAARNCSLVMYAGGCDVLQLGVAVFSSPAAYALQTCVGTEAIEQSSWRCCNTSASRTSRASYTVETLLLSL